MIVNSQRPGPATGLPTRTAQADLQFTIHASQDEFPRFVFAPGSPEEAYKIMIRAFHLSDKYQVPAIVLSDQYLNDSYFIIEESLQAPEDVAHHAVRDDRICDAAAYKRYALNPSGVSPRALPCMGRSLVVVSGDEHREDGHISETVDDRVRMVHKRNRKIPDMQKEMGSPEGYFPDSDTVLVGWGSTRGAVREAVDMMRRRKRKVGSYHFEDLWPFPDDTVKEMLKHKKRIIVVEQNSTAQLGQLIRQQTGIAFSQAVLKHDGRPFYPIEIVRALEKSSR